jgi:hypothetical protein
VQDEVTSAILSRLDGSIVWLNHFSFRSRLRAGWPIEEPMDMRPDQKKLDGTGESGYTN